MDPTYRELSFPERFREARERFRRARESYRTVLLFLLGFAAFFLVLVSGVIGDSSSTWFFLIALFYFWWRSNRFILRLFDPPEELYLALFFLAASLEVWTLNAVPLTNPAELQLPAFLMVVHWFNLLLMVWSGGLLLSKENGGKFGVIITYWLVLVIGHKMIFFGHPFGQVVFVIFLFFLLLKRTRWVEKLTRLELVLYFVAVLILFFNFNRPEYFDYFGSVAGESGRSFYLYSLPKFLFYFGKVYLFVLIVRIPLVLVYNFAPISRKLWIATLFQSTIPQIIQMVVLLFIFYLFISGWQANSLRQSVEKLTRDPVSLQSTSLRVQRLPREEFFKQQSVDQAFSQNPEGLFFYEDPTSRESRYFLYFSNPGSAKRDSVYVLAVDSSFLNYLFQKNRFILGSGIAAFRYRPNPLMAYLYRMKFWQAQPFRINPLGIINPFLIPPSSSAVVTSQKLPGIDRSMFGNWGRLKIIPVVVGRIFLPTGKEDEYFTLNIFYDLGELFRWNFMTQILLVLVFFFFLLNSLIIRRMARFGKQINQLIVEKFRQLRQGVQAVAAGNLDYQVRVPGKDEFSEFAEHFNRMSRELKRFMNQAREKERLDQELRIAHDVQVKMLPESLPEIPGFRLAADLTTANEVGGDFYDVFPLGRKRFFLAIGDVSGKGMSAAFYMAQIISLLRYSTTFTTDLLDLTLRLNEYLVQNVFDPNIFVTAILGILRVSRNEFEFVRAGHNLPILLRNGSGLELEEIATRGMGLGMTRDERILKENLERSRLVLTPGDSLILYTDGYPDAAKRVDGREIFYGEEPFRERLKQCAGGNPGELIHCVKQDLEEFYHDLPRFDDQTILVLKKES